MHAWLLLFLAHHGRARARFDFASSRLARLSLPSLSPLSSSFRFFSNRFCQHRQRRGAKAPAIAAQRSSARGREAGAEVRQEHCIASGAAATPGFNREVELSGFPPSLPPSTLARSRISRVCRHQNGRGRVVTLAALPCWVPQDLAFPPGLRTDIIEEGGASLLPRLHDDRLVESYSQADRYGAHRQTASHLPSPFPHLSRKAQLPLTAGKTSSSCSSLCACLAHPRLRRSAVGPVLQCRIKVSRRGRLGASPWRP